MNTSALLLDLDNTLIDRDRAFLAYWQHFITRHPRLFAGRDQASVLRQISQLDGRGRTDRQLFCNQLLQLLPELPYDAEQLWLDQQQLPDFVVRDPAIIALLERLSQQHRLILLSNGSSQMQRRKLHQAGIHAFFSQILISGEVGLSKPDLALFRYALSFCPEATVVMIGDDYNNDIQPARALGLKTLWLNPEQCLVANPADAVIAQINAVEEALACIL